MHERKKHGGRLSVAFTSWLKGYEFLFLFCFVFVFVFVYCFVVVFVFVFVFVFSYFTQSKCRWEADWVKPMLLFFLLGSARINKTLWANFDKRYMHECSKHTRLLVVTATTPIFKQQFINLANYCSDSNKTTVHGNNKKVNIIYTPQRKAVNWFICLQHCRLPSMSLVKQTYKQIGNNVMSHFKCCFWKILR